MIETVLKLGLQPRYSHEFGSFSMVNRCGPVRRFGY